jgi:PAS domain S-box-containing protein
MRPRSLFSQMFATSVIVVFVAFGSAAWLAILAGRGAMDRLVREILRARARDALEEVDRYLATRAQEVRSWAGLAVMEEVLVQDRGFHIENLLLEVHRERPGAYEVLSVLDRGEVVVASTDVRKIGQQVPVWAIPAEPVPGTLLRSSGLDREGLQAGGLHLAHPILSRMSPAPIGWLAATVRLEAVEGILNPEPGEAGKEGKLFVLFDRTGRPIAGRRDLLDRFRQGRAEGNEWAPALPELPAGELVRAGGYLLVREGPISSPASVLPDLRVVALWRAAEAYAVVRIFAAGVVGAAALGLALAAGATFLTARGISRRLRKVTEGTARLAKGELAYRVEEGREDEIGKLARSFNAMAEQLARARDDLNRALAQWQTLVRYAPDLILMVDREGNVLFANRPLGSAGSEPSVGTTIYARVAPNHSGSLRAALERVFESGEPSELDLEMAGTDGASAWFSVRIGPVARGGEVAAAILIVTDISERKRLEREVLEVSELERRRIGQDLHDELGQVLTGLSFRSKRLERQLDGKDPGAADELREIGSLIGLAMQQTRALAKGLYPVDLDRSGLRAALEEHAAFVEHMFHVSCRIEWSLSFPGPDRARAIHLLRIAQEAVHNAIRHGKAREIAIRVFEEEEGGHVLEVRDDGAGLGVSSRETEGMGLRSMRYRAGAIGGSLELRSHPAGGTVLRVRYPPG